MTSTALLHDPIQAYMQTREEATVTLAVQSEIQEVRAEIQAQTQAQVQARLQESQALPTLCGTEILHLPIDRIAPNPYQPRRTFDRTQMDDLARSIREYGVMQPITVRVINGRKHELVAGERRLRAAKLAGLKTIPAIIISISDRDSAILALIENLQRQNLNFIEEAEGFVNLMNDYNFTQEQLAKRLGKNQSTIANKLRILRLPAAVQQALLDNGLTERHARALLKLESEDAQMQAVQHIIEEGLTVQRTEALVEAMLKPQPAAPEKPEKPEPPTPHRLAKTYIKDLRLFTNSIKQAVDMMNKAGVTTAYDTEETPEGCRISILVTY